MLLIGGERLRGTSDPRQKLLLRRFFFSQNRLFRIRYGSHRYSSRCVASGALARHRQPTPRLGPLIARRRPQRRQAQGRVRPSERTQLAVRPCRGGPPRAQRCTAVHGGCSYPPFPTHPPASEGLRPRRGESSSELFFAAFLTILTISHVVYRSPHKRVYSTDLSLRTTSQTTSTKTRTPSSRLSAGRSEKSAPYDARSTPKSSSGS